MESLAITHNWGANLEPPEACTDADVGQLDKLALLEPTGFPAVSPCWAVRQLPLALTKPCADACGAPISVEVLVLVLKPVVAKLLGQLALA